MSGVEQLQLPCREGVFANGLLGVMGVMLKVEDRKNDRSLCMIL